MASRFPVGGQKRKLVENQKGRGILGFALIATKQSTIPPESPVSLLCLLDSFWSPVSRASHLEVADRRVLGAGTSPCGWC